MLWFLFALLAAVFESIYYVSIKKVGTGNTAETTRILFLSSAGVLLLVSLFKGIPTLQPGFWYYVLASAFVNTLAVALYFRAFQLEDISLALPMISFTPIFLLLTSFLFLHEFPQPFGIVGIFFIVIGSYILYSNGAKKWSDPFHQLLQSRGTRLMLLVAILFSIAANLGKLVILHSDPFFGAFMAHFAIGILFLVWSLIRSLPAHRTIFPPGQFMLVPLGLILGLAAIFESLALFQQIVPYVISVKRLSILFVVVFGGLLFKEKNIGRRTLGAMIMVAGVIIIALSS